MNKVYQELCHNCDFHSFWLFKACSRLSVKWWSCNFRAKLQIIRFSHCNCNTFSLASSTLKVCSFIAWAWSKRVLCMQCLHRQQKYSSTLKFHWIGIGETRYLNDCYRQNFFFFFKDFFFFLSSDENRTINITNNIQLYSLYSCKCSVIHIFTYVYE